MNTEPPKEEVAEPKFPNPVDCSDEEFSKWLESPTLGDTLNVRNFLLQCFSSIKRAKDDLVKEASRVKDSDPDRFQEIVGVLSRDMYPMIQRIENRVFMCNKRIDILAPKDLGAQKSGT